MRFFKSRLFRILLILNGVLAFVGYFAFSTFLFSPLEGPYAFDVSALIPRDVDFFVAKAGLERDFDSFPHLAGEEKIRRHEAWQAFEGSQTWADLQADLDLENQLAELEETLEQIPLGMEPLDIFGGSDVSIAGYFRGSELSLIDWAVYGRANWAGKLGVSLLSYPGLLGLEAQGLSVENGGTWTSISGGSLERPLYVSRVRDVVVVSSSQALAEGAQTLAAEGSTDSLWLSARYQDRIHSVNRNALEDEIEFFIDVRRLLESLGVDRPLPDPDSHLFQQALLARLFQLPAVTESIGMLDVDVGIGLDLHGEFASEKVSDSMGRFYRQRGFQREELLRTAAWLAPADTVLFIYLHGPVGELLRQVVSSLEPAARENIEDFFVSTGTYSGGLDQVISELEGSLKNRLALVVRPNDYKVKYKADGSIDGPPNDGAPVFMFTLVTWLGEKSSHRETIEKLRDTIGQNGSKLGLQGAEGPGSNGFYSYQSGGLETREYWQPLVPGTGVVLAVITTDLVYVSNAISGPGEVNQTYLVRDASRPALAERPDFQALLDDSLPDANALVWIRPEAGLETLREQALRAAETDALTGVNWAVPRAKEENAVLREFFPGRTKASLDESERANFDGIVNGRMLAVRDEMKAERGPELVREAERRLKYLEAVSSALITLRLDPKEFDLSVRVVAPLD